MEGLGEHELAKQCAAKALEIDPATASAHLLLGMLAVDAGDAEGAAEQMEKAIALDPGCAEAYAQHGALMWVDGRKGESLSNLERAFLLLPTSKEIIDSYFGSVEGDEETARALRHLEEARFVYPDHKRLAYWHMTLLATVGRTQEAAAEASSALGAFGVEDSLLTTALELRNAVGPLRTPDGHGVSLCMIVKDEERDLARCIESVRPLIDEIVVVDTGSSDSTRALAAAMGATVVDYAWCDDYAAARNAGLQKAHGAWVLVLDADEVVARADCPKLRRQIAELNSRPAGIVFTTRNYVQEMDRQGWQCNRGLYREEAGSGWIGSDKVRLFPNHPGIRFEHAVHEVVEESLQRAGIPLVHTDVPIHHYGRLDAERTRRKAERYVAIGRAKLASGRLDDARSLLELAAQEQELGNHSEALPLWQRFLELQPGNARAELGLGVSLYELGRWSEAQSVLAEAMVHDPALREAPVKCALAALHCGEAKNAREVLAGFSARFPEYVFGHLALAATLACEGRIGEGQAIVQSIEQRMVRTSPFFRNLSADLSRAGQGTYADRVAALQSEGKSQIS